MIRRYLSVVCSIILLCSSAAIHADEAPQTTEIDPVIITEIYANAPGSGESGNEYIELHNTTASPLVLTGYSLSREGNDTILLLDDVTLAAGEYLAVITPFSLLNTGGTVYLHYPLQDEIGYIIEQSYVTLGETDSWSLVGATWQLAPPSPSEANPLPEEDPIPDLEEEEDDEAPPLCDTTTLFINEIVANPAGSDTNGGEFVELFNDGDEAVALGGCIIKTDKGANVVLEEGFLEPGGYYVVPLSNDLLNGGGLVSLVTYTEELAVSYPSLGDDESWSILNGSWDLTNIATPGEANQATPEEPEPVEEQTIQEPCPAGKFRNPETNRCKNIVSTASSLLPCQPGSVRNPETNRCRKSTSVVSSLKPCEPGQERNPSTNRCRKVQDNNSEQKPCPEGEERNPETNRCRKVSAVLAAADFPDSGESAGIHSGVFTFMTLLALFYGVYEYRLDFVNIFQKTKLRFKGN